MTKNHRRSVKLKPQIDNKAVFIHPCNICDILSIKILLVIYMELKFPELHLAILESGSSGRVTAGRMERRGSYNSFQGLSGPEVLFHLDVCSLKLYSQSPMYS